jgi:gamma-glutamylcyclotransferase (GGCT)/AIG2-like uncharacterized protein YtfP
MTDLVFFYGTLLAPLSGTRRLRVDDYLVSVGRGYISGALFDLGIYPAAVPASDATVWGEVCQMTHPAIVTQALDEYEGCRADDPEGNLYNRTVARVTLEDGRVVEAWTYFYNAPLGRAARIPSGDYLEHLGIR